MRSFLYCVGYRKRGVLRGSVSLKHNLVVLLADDRLPWVVFFFLPRFLCRQLSVDGLWWERAEGLNVRTVPITGGEALKWIPRCRVSELELVVDLVGVYPVLVLFRGAGCTSTDFNDFVCLLVLGVLVCSSNSYDKFD